mgnify:CR=1 FL=1
MQALDLELQWITALADMENEVGKPDYDGKDENLEFKKRIHEKMVAAFCNKTAKISLLQYEINFRNEVMFSHDSCDYNKIEYLGKLLSVMNRFYSLL